MSSQNNTDVMKEGIALAPFIPSDDQQNILTFAKGDLIINIIAVENSDWWFGEDSAGNKGYFPRSFFELRDCRVNDISRSQTSPKSEKILGRVVITEEEENRSKSLYRREKSNNSQRSPMNSIISRDDKSFISNGSYANTHCAVSSGSRTQVYDPKDLNTHGINKSISRTHRLIGKQQKIEGLSHRPQLVTYSPSGILPTAAVDIEEKKEKHKKKREKSKSKTKLVESENNATSDDVKRKKESVVVLALKEDSVTASVREVESHFDNPARLDVTSLSQQQQSQESNLGNCLK
jgi:hypothetical protein